MILQWRSHSIRARLTLWYAAAIAAILLVYAGGSYLFQRRSLYAELDGQLHDDFEAVEESLEQREDGEIVRARRPGAHDDDEDGPGQRWLDVWSPEGMLLYREGPEEPTLPPPASSDRTLNTVAVETVLTAGGGASLRVRSAPYTLGGLPVLIRVARSDARLRHELGAFLFMMGLGLPAAILLACVGGYFLGGRALRPVGQMAARVRTITAERLQERLPIENPDDELGRLGTVFNDTLARLDGSFEALRRFTADAAHELRTPLTALRSVGEVALREPQTDGAYQEVLGSMLEEVDRLASLVDTLLTLSRADGGRAEIQAQRLDLRQFAQEMADYLDVLAEEKGQRIVVEGEGEAYTFADPLVLRQAVLNLLDNAIQHSAEGTRIRVVVQRSFDEAVLEVIDQGPGIEPEHWERIFERFYRIDRARSREAGGAGLGLSIAQWAVRAHGGSIEVESRPGEGSCFHIRLPVAHQGIHAGTTGGSDS